MVSSIIIPRHFRVSVRLADVRAADDAMVAAVWRGGLCRIGCHKVYLKCSMLNQKSNEAPVRCAHLMNTDGHGFYFQSM